MSIARRLASLKLEDANASSKKDKIMIDNLIVYELGGFDKMNRFIRAKMMKALKAAGRHFQEDFAKLLDALASDRSYNSAWSPGFVRIAQDNQQEDLRFRRATVALTDNIS